MGSNVKPHQRAFALTMALVFLVSVIAVSVFTVMAIIDQSRNKDDAAENGSSQQTPTTQPKEGALQGTKLNNFTPVAAVDKLQIIDIKEGNGEVVKAGATVTAHYTGAVAATGIIFQSSHDSGQPIPFSLSGVIKGWTDGVPGMKVGGTRRLVIPADQAYGANPPAGAGIPANAVLVFDIELTAVQQ